MARVIEIKNQGNTRVVKVKLNRTKTGTKILADSVVLERPIDKLILIKKSAELEFGNT